MYNQIQYKDFSYGDVSCNLDSNQLEYMNLHDVDGDCRKEALINVIVDKQSETIKMTNCSETLKL